VETAEKVTSFSCTGGSCFPFPWSSCLKLHFESKAHCLNHNFLELPADIPGEMWFGAKVFNTAVPNSLCLGVTFLMERQKYEVTLCIVYSFFITEWNSMRFLMGRQK
jgi:hypothetical protein